MGSFGLTHAMVSFRPSPARIELKLPTSPQTRVPKLTPAVPKLGAETIPPLIRTLRQPIRNWNPETTGPSLFQQLLRLALLACRSVLRLLYKTCEAVNLDFNQAGVSSLGLIQGKSQITSRLRWSSARGFSRLGLVLAGRRVGNSTVPLWSIRPIRSSQRLSGAFAAQAVLAWIQAFQQLVVVPSTTAARAPAKCPGWFGGMRLWEVDFETMLLEYARFQHPAGKDASGVSAFVRLSLTVTAGAGSCIMTQGLSSAGRQHHLLLPLPG